MNKKLQKKLISLFVILTLIFTSLSVDNLGKVFARTTTATVEINNHMFALSYEGDSGSIPSDITVSARDESVEQLTYPTFSEACTALKQGGWPIASRWSEKMLLSSMYGEYTSITIPSDYHIIPNAYMQGNNTVQNIQIVTKNDITLNSNCISHSSKLHTVSISAPESTVTIETSAFLDNTALQDINITAKKIVIKNAFSQCAPKNITLNGNVSTNSVLGINSLTTLTIMGNTSLPSGFLKDCEIANVSLAGTNTVDQSCFNKCNITNVNLEGTTTFGSSSFSECTIENMSINGKTVFANKTLNKCTVKNLYFNIDNRNNCGNVSYVNGNDRLGYNSTVNNIYFNYADIQGNTGKVQELNNFSLGGDIDENSSLNSDNIFFCDPDFKYIGGGSSYKRTDGGKTNIYGWGGAMAWDTDGNRKSAYDMYKEWIQNETCTFYNYVTNTNSGKALDVFELKVSEVYIPDDATSITYDFSNTENITAWANFEKENNQYAERNEFVRANGKYSMNPITMNTEDSATAFATNFNYRILKKDDSITELSADKYNYFYSSEDAAKGWYTALTTKTDDLTEGNNYYLIEVGGVKYPFTIVAKYNKVEKIDIEGAELQLDAGEKVTPEMLKVTATYTDGTTEILPEAAYEIMDHTIVEGQNIITVRVKAHVSSDEYVTSNFIATGYKDICTGFKASTAITQLYEGGTLNVNDVVLSDVTYANPRKKDENITSGFKFLVNGQESDTYVINNGANLISITYKGYTLENALNITGMKNTITKVEAIYTGTIYEGMRVSTGSAALAVYVYENNETEGTLLTDNLGVTLDPYVIIPGENLINVYYKGIKASKPITVMGIEDYATQITTATYKGSLTVGYCPVVTDIDLQAIMASGRIIDTKLDKNAAAHITIETKQLEETTTTIRIGFRRAVYIIPIKMDIVLPTAIPSAVPSNIPETPETPETPTPSAITTIEPVATSSAPITSVIPTEPVASIVPTASMAAPTAVPQQTKTPLESMDNTVAIDNVKKLPIKGNVYNIAGIKYKILSIDKEKETGTASIVGYTGKKNVKLVTSIKIKGCQIRIVSIAKNAFKNCAKVKGTVVIKDSITTIEKNAFYGCKNITKVVIGSKVKSIGSKSFYGCTKLKTVDLSKASSLSRMSASAFKKNHKKRIFILERKK